MSSQFTRNDVFQLLLRASIASVITYYSIKWMMSQIDPTNKSKKKARTTAEIQLKRLKESVGLKINTNILSDYELVIASHLVVPEDIAVSWKDIAGLDGVIEELRESVVLPIRHRDIFSNSQLWQAPKGVLLHGPPGCGKTLIAKATAKEAGMRFINLDIAMLTDKWYGESQKLASAVFSLAIKLQPCIVFIDEIDSFLRSRNAHDHEATAMMKTQFMLLWDGLGTEYGSTVIVMGATNRPQDLDKAILRRMPAQFHVGLPNEEQRLKILRLVLQADPCSDDVDLFRLSKLTYGFSGSDLRELCRNARVYGFREFIRDKENKDNINKSASGSSDSSSSSSKTICNYPIIEHECAISIQPPPISMEDLLCSFNKMKESKMHTGMLNAIVNKVDLD